tara:strand:+ start:1801 stop:2310 length:510 start_codon:yes stop_codon:yes gene_type:complete
MEENIETKLDFKSKLLNLYNKNKLKILILFLILFASIFLITYIKYDNDKKNKFISEKYIQAGLYLSSEEKGKAKKLYKEIILSKNAFYSVLALNTIIEKNLEKNENEVLSYFTIVQDLDFPEEKLDLINFKKALYLYKLSRNEEGKLLLENLIKKNSKLKLLAEEILSN